MSEHLYTTAAPSPETQAFWDGANAGKLLAKRCKDTGKVFFYPREYSPFTLGQAEWIELSGEATIYSYSISRRAAPPYCIAYVTLKEGPIILSNIVDVDLETVRIGQSVRVVFKAGKNDQAVPMFTPT